MKKIENPQKSDALWARSKNVGKEQECGQVFARKESGVE